MKLTKTVLEKTFIIEHKGREYYVNFADSDGYVLGLKDNENWQINDEDGKELDLYVFQPAPKELKQKHEEVRLFKKLVSFCIKHFNDYQPGL